MATVKRSSNSKKNSAKAAIAAEKEKRNYRFVSYSDWMPQCKLPKGNILPLDYDERY